MPEEKFIQIGYKSIAVSQIQVVYLDKSDDVWIYLVDECDVHLRGDEAEAFRQWWEASSDITIYKVI